DQSMNYNVKFDVPAKYLGTEVTSLISKLTPADQQKIESVPVTANLTGSFSSPAVKTDLKAATTSLVTQLVKMQKDKLLNQGAGALSNILGGNNNNSTTNNATSTTDTTKTQTPPKDQIKDGVKNALNDLLGGKKKKE